MKNTSDIMMIKRHFVIKAEVNQSLTLAVTLVFNTVV